MTSIVLTICAQHNIAPALFFSDSRSAQLSRCRHDAMHALRNAGFDYETIARLTKRKPSSVLYWLNEEYRERTREGARARKRKEIA